MAKVDRNTEIIELTSKGLSIREIADQTGCSKSTVANVRKQLAKNDPLPRVDLPPASGSGTDPEVASELRSYCVARARRIEALCSKIEARLDMSLDDAATASGRPKEYAIALGVLIDKQLALVRAAKELSPSKGVRAVRPVKTLPVVGGAKPEELA